MMLTNLGHCPVSFNTARKALDGTGFSVNLAPKVRSLPGAPHHESLEFMVQFDPASVHLTSGSVQALLPFNVSSCICIQYYYNEKEHSNNIFCFNNYMI